MHVCYPQRTARSVKEEGGDGERERGQRKKRGKKARESKHEASKHAKREEMASLLRFSSKESNNALNKYLT